MLLPRPSVSAPALEAANARRRLASSPRVGMRARITASSQPGTGNRSPGEARASAAVTAPTTESGESSAGASPAASSGRSTSMPVSEAGMAHPPRIARHTPWQSNLISCSDPAAARLKNSGSPSPSPLPEPLRDRAELIGLSGAAGDSTCRAAPALSAGGPAGRPPEARGLEPLASREPSPVGSSRPAGAAWPGAGGALANAEDEAGGALASAALALAPSASSAAGSSLWP
mmetsp:Transcript_4120/g.17300  ORF Transcript_4120/g.17300 Transcript_4120/m.17300 type:complete len:231 (+) Transcript_4120:534-1226(+)